MTVSELKEMLKGFNPDAEVMVVVDDKGEDFDINYGWKEGCSQLNCDMVFFDTNRSTEKSQ